MYLIKDVWEPTGNTKEEAAVERPIRTSLGKCALLHQGFVSPPMLLQQRNYNQDTAIAQIRSRTATCGLSCISIVTLGVAQEPSAFLTASIPRLRASELSSFQINRSDADGI